MLLLYILISGGIINVANSDKIPFDDEDVNSPLFILLIVSIGDDCLHV